MGNPKPGTKSFPRDLVELAFAATGEDETPALEDEDVFVYRAAAASKRMRQSIERRWVAVCVDFWKNISILEPNQVPR